MSLDFSDESYVRLYTRDTKTWLRLGFEGQAVLMFLIRKLDRAGVLDGIEEPVADVSLVTGVPLGVVEVGLARLLERGVLERHEDRIVMPNYVEAQNCRQTDRLRKSESRASRSAQARLVTKRDPIASRSVTESHPPSPLVTNGHSNLSDPILAHLSKAEREDARAQGSVPDVPGLETVHPGPLPQSKRERAECDAMTDKGNPRYEFTEGWTPTKANQARGHELGLTDEEIWARWEICKDKPFQTPFRSDVKQFNRELAFAAQDKTTVRFKSAKEREAFEMPGRERRA